MPLGITRSSFTRPASTTNPTSGIVISTPCHVRRYDYLTYTRRRDLEDPFVDHRAVKNHVKAVASSDRTVHSA